MQRREENNYLLIRQDTFTSIASQSSLLSAISVLKSAMGSVEEQASVIPTTTSPYSTTPTQDSSSYLYSSRSTKSLLGVLSPSQSSTDRTVLSSTSATSATSTPIVFNGTASYTSGVWGRMAQGAHVGVIVSIVFGVLLIILFSIWFCCGGRALWSSHQHRHEQSTEAGELPLYTVRGGRNTQPGVHRPEQGGGDAPPIYAEVPPPEHQTVAGGIRGESEVQRLEDEAAVVSDGKTPLSEIPFEDVVLERHPSASESSGSASASRMFHQTHHGIGGDTTGHTNT
jgi:hypothetical protein